MARHFAFNGDADGLCALQQLRLAWPGPASLATGVKRDIRLVDKLAPRSGDEVIVLDVAYGANAAAVASLLAAGVRVRYFDHHEPGTVPAHERFECHISTDRDACTSLLVDRYLNGERRAWAIVGAFGDGLDQVAEALAAGERMPAHDIATLRELGVCINYNSYGDSEADLFIAPLQLHERLIRFSNPVQFAAEEPVFRALKECYQSDLNSAQSVIPAVNVPSAAVFVLPNEPWARRVSGTWAHWLAKRHPERAHAVVTTDRQGTLTVSVRSARQRPVSAVAFCRRFPGGGGRESAAGINRLPREALHSFCAAFVQHFS